MNFTIQQPADISKFAVPIGSILPFVGSLNNLPEGWQPCDGRLINNPQSPFNDKKLPSLMDDRFLMGVSASTDVGTPGGSNTINTEGPHSHGGVTNGFGGYQPGEINYDRGPGRQDPYMMRFGIQPDGQHDHGGDKRPAFCGVYFIIRIL